MIKRKPPKIKKRLGASRPRMDLRQRLDLHLMHYLSTATPHGLVHLVRPNRSRCEKVFWISCMIICIVPCIIIGKEPWERYFYHPTVTTLERDHHVWNHTFPGVTICPMEMNAVDEDVLDLIYGFFDERGFPTTVRNATENDTREATPEQVAEMRIKIDNFIKILIYGNFSAYKHLSEFVDDFSCLNPNEYLDLNNLTSALNKNFHAEQEDFFSIDQIITERGICYSANSLLANYTSPEKFKNKNVDYLPNQHIVENKAGDEAPYLNLHNLVAPALVYYHSYNEIISLKDKAFILGYPALGIFAVTTERHYTSTDIRHLTISQRNCRFPDESNLKYFPVYSYNLCRLECRMKWALIFCHCFPYYYRSLYGEKICSLEGMMCLSDYKYELEELQNKTTGKSLCSRCEHNCENEVVFIHNAEFTDWIFNSVLQIIFYLKAEQRMKKFVIFSETDFLVQIGGLAGLSYGIGILSIVEIIYFCTLRFYWAVIRDKTIKT